MQVSDYRQNPAFNQTFLKNVLVSPAHAMAWKDKQSTPDMEIGTAFHSYILEPDSFFDRYFVEEKLNWNTKEGKIQKVEFERISARTGMKYLPKPDFDRIRAMREAVAQNALAASYIWGGTGETEKAIYWDCHFTGAPCKALIDRIIPGVAIVDLKKIGKVATEKALAYHVRDYGYDFQAAFYQEGWRKVAGETLPFLFVFVEDAPPYGVRVVTMDAETMDIARGKVVKSLEIALYCQQSGQWPAYEQKLITLKG